MPDDSPWPRVSTVTPSYNQAQFLEETIRSVLLQGYPDLEYIIIDGGSTDSSAELIRKYEPWLAYWVSEPDEGQVYAIDKGWTRSTGRVLAYLNSDDTYLPGAIGKAVQALITAPQAVAICGGELRIDRDGMVLSENVVGSATLFDLLNFRFIPQPAVFMQRSAYARTEGLDLIFHTAFDFEFWTRLVQHGPIHCIPAVLATTRWYAETKTLSQRPMVISELEAIVRKVFASPMGQQLCARDRRIIRARLHYVASDVYLDNLPESARLLFKSLCSAAIFWPPMLPDLAYLVAVKLLPGSTIWFLRHCKRRIMQQEPLRAKPKVHWSHWRPQLDTPSGEAA